MSKSKSKSNGVIELPYGANIRCPDDGGPIQGSVIVDFNGGQFTCPDARSLVTAISMTLAQHMSSVKSRKQGDGSQGSGPERAWADAREHAKNFNNGRPESEWITDDQARKILAGKKRVQKLQALLRKKPPAIE